MSSSTASKEGALFVSSYLSNGKRSRGNGSKRSNVGRIGKGRGVRKSGETAKTGELEEEEVETNLDGEEDDKF